MRHGLWAAAGWIALGLGRSQFCARLDAQGGEPVQAANSKTMPERMGAPDRGADFASAVIEVDFTNPELAPSHWVLTLMPDGSGHFWSEEAKTDKAAAPGEPPPAPPVDRDIRVSAEYARSVFEQARSHRLFAMECESKIKVAFQGWKKLTYRGPEGHGSCGFNYAKDRQLQQLGESLVAVAGTIVEGSRLDWLQRFDPLGLDREMQYVSEAAADGRLQELGAIRAVLERLAGDDAVLDRVRKRARALVAGVRE